MCLHGRMEPGQASPTLPSSARRLIMAAKGVRSQGSIAAHNRLTDMLRSAHHLAAALALLLAVATPHAFAAKKEAPPALAASAYPAHDTHEKEHVTIGVEPFDTRAKGEFFRNDYAGHSILPVRLVIQNDSDAPLDLNQARMQFIAADGTKLPAATPDELNRRLFPLHGHQAEAHTRHAGHLQADTGGQEDSG